MALSCKQSPLELEESSGIGVQLRHAATKTDPIREPHHLQDEATPRDRTRPSMTEATLPYEAAGCFCGASSSRLGVALALGGGPAVVLRRIPTSGQQSMKTCTRQATSSTKYENQAPPVLHPPVLHLILHQPVLRLILPRSFCTQLRLQPPVLHPSVLQPHTLHPPIRTWFGPCSAPRSLCTRPFCTPGCHVGNRTRQTHYATPFSLHAVGITLLKTSMSERQHTDKQRQPAGQDGDRRLARLLRSWHGSSELQKSWALGTSMEASYKRSQKESTQAHTQEDV